MLTTARRVALMLLFTFFAIVFGSTAAQADPSKSVPGDGVTQGTVWKTHDIWVSDRVQDPRWPVQRVLDLWNQNGVVKFHYTTKSCNDVVGTCIPVKLGLAKRGDTTIAYANVSSEGSVFTTASVTLLIDRGARLNSCTLLHEFGHVIANIPHGWRMKGREAPSVMNGECDRQVAEGEQLKLPSADKWYVETVYRTVSAEGAAARVAKAVNKELRERVREGLPVGPTSPLLLNDGQTMVILFITTVVAGVTFGASATVLIQQARARRKAAVLPPAVTYQQVRYPLPPR